jgi:D-tyrosyl-tRNA(Tyr) deacylase
VRALLQRVTRAEVRVGDEVVGRIGPGLLVLAGIGPSDDETVVAELARRIVDLRIFRDEAGRTNRSIADIRGEALVVSQFTLWADTHRGRRPGFTGAAPAEQAERLYGAFAAALGQLLARPVPTGRFGAEMAVELVNDGPFTIWLDTDDRA